jgi:hypothetical protein
MKVTITSIELKSPFHFFALSRQAMQIIRQLRATEYKAFKKQGIWTTHYTMTLWENEAQLRAFATSGAHLAAMRRSGDIARAIKTVTIDADVLPSWRAAKRILKEVEPLIYAK